MKSILHTLIVGETTHGPLAAAPLFGFASHMGAHVSVAVGAPMPSVPVVLPVASVRGLIGKEQERVHHAARAIADSAGQVGAASGVPISAEIIEAGFDTIAATLARRARLHDLVSVQPSSVPDMLRSALIEGLIFHSGRPVLLLPAATRDSWFPNYVVVSWDGGMQAARAVFDSLPILRHAKRVEILCVTGERDLPEEAAGSALAPTLARHGIDITVNDLPLQGTVAGTLRNHALGTRADLLVMGAYGHSRWREFVLGGATRDILRDQDLPILMSH